MAVGIKEVTTDESIAAAAQALGEEVSTEDGLANAISFIDEMAESFEYPWRTAQLTSPGQ